MEGWGGGDKRKEQDNKRFKKDLEKELNSRSLQRLLSRPLSSEFEKERGKVREIWLRLISISISVMEIQSLPMMHFTMLRLRLRSEVTMSRLRPCVKSLLTRTLVLSSPVRLSMMRQRTQSSWLISGWPPSG